MSSTLVFILASMLFWFNSVSNKEKKQPLNRKNQIVETTSPKELVSNQQERLKIGKENHPFANPDFLNEGTSNISYNDSLLINPDMIKSTILNAAWLKDTVYNGEKFIATLSDAEMENLGFQLEKNGIFYKNEWEGKLVFFHSVKDSNNSDVSHSLNYASPYNKKKKVSHFDFYPNLISSNVYSLWNKKCENFAFTNDTLFPVMIKHSQLKNIYDDLILWFNLSPSLFAHLPERYRKFEKDFEQIKHLKKQDPKSDIVRYQPKKITDGLHFIELSKPELERMGFEIKDKNIYFSITDIKKDSMRFFITHNGLGVEFNDSVVGVKKKLNIVYLTNEYGEKRIQWQSTKDPDDKNTLEKIIENSQYLIPVLLKQMDYPHILDENEIFWFRPSEAFFDSLPERYKEPIKSEYHYLTDNSREVKNLSTSCTFFEECKSTLQLNRLKIYPNPASQVIQVEFDVDEPVSGQIVLVNISGSQVKELEPETKWQKGLNFFQMDVSDVVSGIYLLTIKTQKGFKTQRVIIAH